MPTTVKTIVDGLTHLLLLFGAVVLGDDHARAAGQPQKEADQHVDNGGNGAHSGVGLVAHIPAHHPQVHRVVELLKEVPQQQWNGKADQMAHHAALGHIH